MWNIPNSTTFGPIIGTPLPYLASVREHDAKPGRIFYKIVSLNFIPRLSPITVTLLPNHVPHNCSAEQHGDS
jgi:hypothetical protein